MGIVLGTLGTIGAAIATAAVNVALDVGLLLPIYGPPVIELGALFSAGTGSVLFSTLPVVTYEVIGVSITVNGILAVAGAATVLAGGIIGGSVAAATSNKTDSVGSGKDIFFEPALEDYLSNRGNSLTEELKKYDDGKYQYMRDPGVKKVRVESGKKRQRSMQPAVSESVSEELEQQFSSGQSGSAKGRKVARSAGRLRKKSNKR